MLTPEGSAMAPAIKFLLHMGKVHCFWILVPGHYSSHCGHLEGEPEDGSPVTLPTKFNKYCLVLKVKFSLTYVKECQVLKWQGRISTSNTIAPGKSSATTCTEVTGLKENEGFRGWRW